MGVGDNSYLIWKRLHRPLILVGLTDIYNPFSILNVFKKMELQDYWFSLGTPTYLLRLLSHAQGGLDEMTGRYYFRRDFIDYKATVEKPLPMIYQSGYPEWLPDH